MPGSPRSQVPPQTLPLSLQTPESSILGSGQEKGLNVQDRAQDTQPTCLPALIREIVTRNFSQPESPGTTPLHRHCLHLTSSHIPLLNSHNDDNECSFHFLNNHCEAGTSL